MRKLTIIAFGVLLSILCLSTEAMAQSVRAKVTDSSGAPIAGATAVSQDGKSFWIADNNGVVVIDAKPGTSITFSCLGYEDQQIVLNSKDNLTVVMTDSDFVLNSVVVVGYGTQKKETVTGSISQVSGESILRSPTANISNAIVGRVSGLTSVQKTGEAGHDETTIRIRGIGTYNGDQNPLVVIDGVIRDMTAFNMLDGNDVERINVLKDASSTAVYGVRGANGVIIVTTKRGDVGKAKVSLTANFGLTTPTTLVSFVDSYNYALLKNEAYINDGKAGNTKMFTEDEIWKFQNNRDYTPEEVAAMDFLTEEQKQTLLNSPAVFYGSTDYMKAIFGSTLAPQQQYNVNVSGGTDKVGYFASVGYLNQRSLLNDFGIKDCVGNTGSDRISFRTNLDFRMIKYTDIKVSIAGQMKNASVVADNTGGSGMGSRYHHLLLNIYEAPPFSGQGVYGDKVIGNYAGDGPLVNKYAWGKTPIAYMLEKRQLRETQTSLNTSININHRMDYLTEGLSLRGAVSYDHYFSKTLSVSSGLPTYEYTLNPENPSEILFFGGDEKAVSYSESGWSKSRKFYFEAGVDYRRSFAKHNVSAMLLVTGERYTANGLKYNVPRGYYGIVGRVTYGYAERYFAEFNMGYNGSENFAPGKRFGFFPAVSAGWALSNEPFFPKNNIVTWLKFRASYGQTGNSNIGGSRFMYLPGTWGTYGYGNPMQGYQFGTSDGSTINPEFPGKYELSTGNPDVTWEKKESYNVGIDLNMFRDRLTITADMFQENRNNILTTLQIVSGTVGLDSGSLPPVNVGKMTNKGYEIEVKWADRVGRDFQYEIGGNLSYSVNKIIYQAEPAYQYEWMNATGFAYGQMKALYNEGFYNSAIEAANHPYNDIDANKVQPGDLRIVDIDGDGKIDSNDYVPYGFSNIPRFAFSGNISLCYKGFGVSLLFTGSAQGSFGMADYLITPFAQGQSTPLSYMMGRWTPERAASGEEVTFPRLSVNIATSQNNSSNSFWIRSTDHFKLKNAELFYDFAGQAWMRRCSISGLRVYFNANNLFTVAKHGLIDGIDPELTDDTTSNRGLIYPLTRIYNIGFNIEF